MKWMYVLSLGLAVLLMTALLGGCGVSAPSTDPPTVPTVTTAPTTTAVSPITAEQAMQIALADAGLTEADVTQLHTEAELYDYTPHYDVHFRVNHTEYDYEIGSDDGRILEKDIDLFD